MSKIAKPSRTFRSIVKAQEEEARKRRSTSPFVGTGMHPNGNGGLDSDNYVAGSSGYHFGADGNAEFNDVTIRGAAIGIDAPVQIDIWRLSASGFGLTTSYSQKDSQTVTVPPGCTRVKAVLNARMYAVNQNTTGGSDGSGGDAIYVQATIAGNVTGGSPVGLSGFNGFTTTTSFDSFALSGLTPGSTLTLGVEGKSGYQSIPSYVDTNIKAVATLTWLR